MCATLLHYNPSLAQIMTSHHITQQKSCGDGGISKATGMDTLEAVAVNLHTDGSGHWVTLQSRLRLGWSAAAT